MSAKEPRVLMMIAVLSTAGFSIATMAEEGRHEINQACVAVGCFPGDLAGFPVEVKHEGSYVLTSDLDVSGETNPEDVSAIVVSGTQGVTIDLNGFMIVGGTFCVGTPPSSCSPTGTGSGIQSLNNSITIRNGKIFQVGSHCIEAISAIRVENMHLEDCGGNGIKVGQGSFVIDNVVRRSGGNGVEVGTSSIARGNLIHANIGFGLKAPTTATYGQNLISGNSGGAVDGAPVQLGENVCGVSLCPDP